MAFYVLDARIKSKANDGINIINLKSLFVQIQIMLTSKDGDIFTVGYAKHCLADRPKSAIIDLELFKIGEK